MIVAFADVDAAYGRLAGDVAIAASAGAATGMTTATSGARFNGDLRLRYLQTAGVFGTVEAGDHRLVATGIELRPLFVSRWALGRELGNPRLDMLIDSAALELGVAFRHPGLGLSRQISSGGEGPVGANAAGPFIGLHTGLRWSEDALAGNGAGAVFVAAE